MPECHPQFSCGVGGHSSGTLDPINQLGSRKRIRVTWGVLPANCEEIESRHLFKSQVGPFQPNPKNSVPKRFNIRRSPGRCPPSPTSPRAPGSAGPAPPAAEPFFGVSASFRSKLGARVSSPCSALTHGTCWKGCKGPCFSAGNQLTVYSATQARSTVTRSRH